MRFRNRSQPRDVTRLGCVAGWALAASLHAAAAGQMRPSFAPDETLLPAEGVSIPMERVRRLPLVSAMINGKGPYRLVVDTGAPGLVLTNAAADTLALGSPPGMPPGVVVKAHSGDGGAGVPARLLFTDTLRLGRAEFRKILTIALDLPMAGAFDGVLGMGVFGDTLLTIDYPEARIGITRGALEPDDDRSVLAYRTAGPPSSHPRIDVAMGAETTTFLIDSGMSGWLGVEDDFLAGFNTLHGPVPGPRARTVDSASRSGFARLDTTLRIGEHEFVAPIVQIGREERPPVIGSAILEHFAVTFDQKQHLVRFERPGDGPIVVPAQRVLGFDVDRADDGFVIWDLVPGSPAETSGLRVGDRVVSIDGMAIESVFGSPVWSTLETRESVRVGVARGEEIVVSVYELVP